MPVVRKSLDPAGAMYAVPEPNGIPGVTPAGRTTYYSPEEFELLAAEAVGSG